MLVKVVSTVQRSSRGDELVPGIWIFHAFPNPEPWAYMAFFGKCEVACVIILAIWSGFVLIPA